jgi:hypothetical protein
MAQTMQGYFLTKKEFKAINFLLKQSVKYQEEIVATNDIDIIKELQKSLEYNINSSIQILNY